MKRSHEVMVAAEDASMTSEGSGSVVASTPVVQHVLIKDHDLLPKVLGFVLDSKNYFVLSSVCRAWKRGILEEMEPPFLDEMARLSLQHDENGTPIPPQVALPLFKQALVTLQYRNSKIYRGQETKKNNTTKPPTSSSTRQKKLVLLPLTETEGSVSFTKWPSLMPRSHVTLSYFFWIICLQETTTTTPTTTNPSLPPHDHDQQLQLQQQLQQQQQQQSYCFTDRLYEITKDFVERLFRVNMEHCATALLREGRNVEPLLQLAKLVAIWRRLRGISKIVIGMTNNYFDKFYYNHQHQPHHHVGLVPRPHEQGQQQPKLVVVPTIQEIADRALLVSLEESFSDSTSWDKTTSEATSRLDIVMEQVLKEIATEESGRAFLEHLPLLEKSCEACEGLRAMLERHNAAVAAALAVAVEDEQEPAACFSVTTSESIIQMCTRISAALRPVIEAMKKVVVVVENEDMGAALLKQQS